MNNFVDAIFYIFMVSFLYGRLFTLIILKTFCLKTFYELTNVKINILINKPMIQILNRQDYLFKFFYYNLILK